jgi:hypothetical protein
LLGVHRVGEVVASELVALEELADGPGTEDVEASGATGDAPLDVDASAAVFFVVDAVICAGVEVEETNGGAFSIYEPLGCTAWSRSPLGVSYKYPPLV